jgi:hypothetical protein
MSDASHHRRTSTPATPFPPAVPVHAAMAASIGSIADSTINHTLEDIANAPIALSPLLARQLSLAVLGLSVRLRDLLESALLHVDGEWRGELMALLLVGAKPSSKLRAIILTDQELDAAIDRFVTAYMEPLERMLTRRDSSPEVPKRLVT